MKEFGVDGEVRLREGAGESDRAGKECSVEGVVPVAFGRDKERLFFVPLDNGGCANQRAKAQESLVELQGCRAALSLDVKFGGLDSGELQYTAEVSRT